MTAIADILRGELETHFELDEMKTLSHRLLGLDPASLGADTSKAAFARALVDRCAADDALGALGEAMRLSSRRAATAIEGAIGAPAGPLEAGATVGPYTIQSRLRPAPFGTHYVAGKGTGNGQGGQVTLAVLHGVADRGAALRYLTVARALKDVRVPGMATIVDAGTLDDGTPWVAWEHVDGPTLTEAARGKGALSLEDAVGVGRAVLEALAVLHQRGVVHGAVDPDHVVVGAGGATLVDPGTDRLRPAAGAGTRGDAFGFLGVVGGGAQDPAAIAGGASGPATDVYGAGLVLFSALAGRPPFVGEHALEVAVAHLTRVPPPPSRFASSVPTALDDVVAKALATDPGDRFEDAAAMLEGLENAVAGAPSVPPPTRPGLDDAALGRAVEALRQSPGDEDAAAAVERVVAPSGAFARAVDAFLEVADGAGDARAKRALRLRAARLQHAELHDGEAAEATYRELLEADPEDAVALQGLEDAKRAAGHWEELVELLLERAEKETSAASRAAVFRELGDVYRHELGDEDNAFVAYLHALGEDPRDERLATLVERLARTPERWTEATTALSEPAQSSEDPAARVALYLRLGKWYAGRLQRPDYAVQCFGQALAIDPSTDEAYDATIEVYRRSEAWNELVQVLVQRADATSNPARARDLRTEAADVLRKHLGDAFRATTLLRGVLDEDPGHPAASAALEGLLTEKGDWDALIAHLDHKAQHQEDEARAATLVQIAEVYEDRLDDLDKAVVGYESIAATHPTNLQALKGLERIYARRDQKAELLENLQQQLVVAPTPRQKILLHERVGALFEEEFVDREKAAAHFEKIVAIDPAHEAANAALARIYRQLERWDALAATYERHAVGVDEPKRRVALLVHAVDTLEKRVGAPDRALELAERAVEIDGEDPSALAAVARLKAAVGDQQAAVSALDKLVGTESEPGKKADLAVEAGDILAARGDNDGAIERYKLALDLAPGHAKAFAALRKLLDARGDASGQVDLLDREIAVTDGAMQKAKLFAEKGRVLHERLGDVESALEAYGAALRLDSTSTAAAMGLGDIAHGAGDWPKVAEYYEPLLARTDGMEPEVATRVAVRAGDAFRELGLPDQAQRAYLTARSFAPDDPDVAERVADASLDAGDVAEAVELYRELLERFGGELAGRRRGKALLHFGQALVLADQASEAEKPLVEAAELLPEDLEPLRLLRERYAAAERWDDVLAVVRKGLDRATTDEDRFELRLAAGDVLDGKLGKRDEAAEQYGQALQLRANHRGLLARMMNVYSERNDWPKLLDTIVRIADLVEDPRARAKYWLTAGSIAHHETGDVAEAKAHYARAVEGDPRLRDAFEGLVACLGDDVDTRIEAHRTQLARLEEVGAEGADVAWAWDGLARALEDAGRGEEAVDALTRAQELDPTDRERTQRLAKALAAAPGDRPDRAIEAHRSLLAENPLRVESHRALLELFQKAGRTDEAWAVAASLHAVGSAEPADDELFRAHAAGPALGKGAVSREAFEANLRHPRENPVVTGIFASVTPVLLATRGRALEDLGLTTGDRVEPGGTPLAGALRDAARALQMELPAMYRRGDDPGALGFLPTNPPAVSLGQAADAGGPDAALAFAAARHLAYFRTGTLIRQLVPSVSGLRAWLLAGIKVIAPRFPVPDALAHTVHAHHGAVDQHLRGSGRDQLRGFVERLLDAPEIDVKRWVEGVDLTADRVGFALANDLSLAVAMVKAAPADAAAVPTNDRIRELHAYAVSASYHALRKQLGVAV